MKYLSPAGHIQKSEAHWKSNSRRIASCLYAFCLCLLLLPIATSAYGQNRPTVIMMRWTGSPTCGISEAINRLPRGGTLILPEGTCVLSQPLFITDSEITLMGAGQDATIITTDHALSVKPTAGLVNLGFNALNVFFHPSNITLAALTVDGKFLNNAISARQVAGVLIDHVTARNSADRPPVTFWTAENVMVSNCQLEGGRGMYGDGLGLYGVVNGSAVSNTVSDFTRIGIVGEADVANSQNLTIADNVIRYAHNSSGTEFNGGIWLENVDGANIITGNDISDVTNSPRPNSNTYGIVVKNSSVATRFTIAKGSVSGAQIGVWIDSPGNDVVVEDLRIERGTLPSYWSGILVYHAKSVSIQRAYFGVNAFVGSQAPINMNLLGQIDTFEIADSSFAPGGTMTAMLAISGGYPGTHLGALKITNLQDWKIGIFAYPDVFSVIDSNIAVEHNAYSALQQRSQITLQNSTVTTY